MSKPAHIAHKKMPRFKKLKSSAFSLKREIVFGHHHGRRALAQKNIVFGLRLHYKSAHSSNHSSKSQECFENPDIFSPACDCLNCGGTGCQFC
jgi:hypothetical protein